MVTSSDAENTKQISLFNKIIICLIIAMVIVSIVIAGLIYNVMLNNQAITTIENSFNSTRLQEINENLKKFDAIFSEITTISSYSSTSSSSSNR